MSEPPQPASPPEGIVAAPPSAAGRIWRFFGPPDEPWLRLLALAIVTGVLSGLSAVALRSSVHHLHTLFEASRRTLPGILLPAVGALLGAFLVLRVFREEPDHGVPEVIRAVCRRGGRMRRRSIASRWMGSLLNVASGGSAGLEGPIVFSGAAVGAAAGSLFGLDERRRSVLLACGAAGGIAAIFNAPMTGMIFSMEVVLAEWSALSILPVTASAVCATTVARVVLGNESPFRHATFAMGVWDLAGCVVLGLVCGVASLGLTHSIESFRELARKIPRGGLLAPFAFGLLVGLIALVAPEATGEGYGTVQRSLSGGLEGGLLACFLVVLAKIAATGLTLGSGAPGGVFAPSLVTGALLGTSFYRSLHALLPASIPLAVEGSYALVGMAGLMAGVMQAPLTGILLVMEVTGGYEVILPLMSVSVFSLIVVRSFDRHSIYTRELVESGDLLRPGTDRRILADVSVGESVETDATPLSEDLTLAELPRFLKRTSRNHFPVLEGGDGRFLGMLELRSILDVLLDPALSRVTLVGTVMDAAPPCVSPGDSLADAIGVFERTGAWVLAVVDGERFVGLLSKSGLLDHYRHELSAQAP